MTVQRVMGRPIILERVEPESKKRKKNRLQGLNRMEREIYRASDRTAKAATRGVQRYEKGRKKSAKRERDGAIIDLMPNLARGGAVSAARMAPVPFDMVRAGFSPTVRRATRRSVRATARMLDRS